MPLIATVVALLPAGMLGAFFLAVYRGRLSLELGAEALGLGVVAAMIVASLALLAGHPMMASATPIRAAAFEALLVAAVPEELAKFAVLWLFVRRHEDCETGGDLFCAAVLVGLGFAGVENVGYVADAGSKWIAAGSLRGILPVPGHAVFGILMGHFLAQMQRGRMSAGAAIALALAVPMAAHALYDFPLLLQDRLRAESGHPSIGSASAGSFLVVVAVTGIAAVFMMRFQLAESTREIARLPASAGASRAPSRWWRWAGLALIVCGVLGLALAVLIGALEKPAVGAELAAACMYPVAFGAIMRQRRSSG